MSEQSPQLAMMGLTDHGLASREMVAWANVSGSSALLQKLLHHPKRDAVTSGDLFSGAFLMVVGIQNPFAQIQ
jgi:hypothetical protein